MKKISFKIGILISFLVVIACSSENITETPLTPIPVEPIQIPSYPQKTGDPAIGFDYLINGDYMSSGVPYEAFILGIGEDSENLLNRTGDNATIAAEYTAIDAPNGVRIVAPNCMQCHSAKINNQFILGLGSHDYDFTLNRGEQVPILTAAISILFGADSDEADAYEILKNNLTAIGSKTITKTRGSNPADKITQVLSTHRDKNTLEWLETPRIDISDEVIPTDVPAWWLLKKKNAMFYHAIGREDFTKYIMALGALTLENSTKADEINKKFEDVLAYIYSIEAPEYPFEIDDALANQGKVLFDDKCSKCHGTYGDNESYPNLLIPLETVNTDAALSDHYTNDSPIKNYFEDWANTGWFGSNDGLKVVAEGGYIAPPLDGIWATAPYFHNGSVPTLENVLNSTSRPTYWSRTFDNTDYDKEKIGWNYTSENFKVDNNTYDTTLFAHGKSGHIFGDGLSTDERKAVIEYLKTL